MTVVYVAAPEYVSLRGEVVTGNLSRLAAYATLESTAAYKMSACECT